MPSEDYHKAMRQGLKEVKAAQALGEETGPRTLPDAPEKLAVRRESLGLAEIPVEQIDGTCNHLRGDAFSRGFYPILPADTEFAAKWSALCRIHLEEGIRDPVKVVEYLNHFYVMEGHKRVSVLKYFGAITIPATVTRLLPKPSDDPEVAAYYEFLDFYKMTGLNFIVFRQPGEYPELLEALGRSDSDAWSAEDIYSFRAFFYMFRDAYLRGDWDYTGISLAFLTYIKIFGYQESCGKMPSQICEELSRIRPEIQNRLENAGTALLLEDDVKKPRFSFYTPGRVCAAFIHDSSAAASKWVYSHEYGRHILENFTDGQVRTLSYENVRTDGEVDQAVEDAVGRQRHLHHHPKAAALQRPAGRSPPGCEDPELLPEHLLPFGAHLLPPAVRGQVYQGGHCRHSDPGRLHRLCSRLPYLRQHRQHQCLRPGSPDGERQRPHLSGLGPSPGRRRGGTSPGPGDRLYRLPGPAGRQHGHPDGQPA